MLLSSNKHKARKKNGNEEYIETALLHGQKPTMSILVMDKIEKLFYY